MSSDTTLFSHIVRSKLEGQVENIAVEALGYILSRSEAARRALVETLRAGEMKVNSIARVETQITMKKGERPDLVCYDGDGYGNVLIEAKFWAELTDNQPNQYLLKLSQECQERAATLLFVAPRMRLETLWQELCGKAKEEFGLTVVSGSGPVYSASVGCGGLYLQLVSWADLLEGIAKAACEENDNDAEADVRQLRGLTDYANPDPFASWSPGKLEYRFARRLEGLKRLVDEAANCGESSGFLKTGIAKGGAQGGHGRLVRLGGVQFWYGIDVFAWAKFHNTPLWLRVGRGKYSQLKEVQPPLQLIDPGPGYDIRIPIELPAKAEYVKMLSTVVNFLYSVARRLDQSISSDEVEGAVESQMRRASDRLDGFCFLPWEPEELEPECARRLVALHGIIEEAVNCGKDAAFLQQPKKRLKQEGYGWSIQLEGVKMWFGADLKAWAQHCITPLWLEFEHEEQREVAFVTDVSKKVGWKHCIPIDVPATAEHDEVLDSVVASLKNIADRLTAPEA